jgi:hypothetical protein
MTLRLFILIGLVTVKLPIYVYSQDVYSDKVNASLGVGVTQPVSATGRFVGSNVNVVMGAGYNFDKHNSVIGEFMYANLPPTRTPFSRFRPQLRSTR